MTPKPHSAALPAGDAGLLARPSEPGPFVINLCSSTTPMALVQPESPELRRFTFFMSRRREDGRERFRLHMGYFVTAAEADEWLNVVREIFPGAWVGEAPGKRLRERQAAAQAQTAAAAAAPPPPPRAPAPPPVTRAAARPAQQPARASAPPPRVPTVHAANRAAAAAAYVQSAAVARAPAARPASPPPSRPLATPAARAVPARPAAQSAPVRTPAPAARPAQRTKAPAGSNVREVLAQLDSPAAAAPPKTRTVPNVRPTSPTASLSDTQVLKILEQRDEQSADASQNAIAMLKPDDTGTRRALREAVAQSQPVAFAVQLQWSVQPIHLQSVPPLAIFSAYTLYTVEGNRDGRKWFGLRLGFFSDAISAKQVAYYVRSDFTSVAVVPVSPQERTRALDAERRSPTLAQPIPVRDQPEDEFKLIDDEPAKPAAPAPAPVRPKPAATPKPAAAPRAAARPAGRTTGRAKNRPETLEETLEILGASALEIDNGRGELINETGVRHLKVEVRKETAFTRLLDRLSERIKP